MLVKLQANEGPKRRGGQGRKCSQLTTVCFASRKVGSLVGAVGSAVPSLGGVSGSRNAIGAGPAAPVDYAA